MLRLDEWWDSRGADAPAPTPEQLATAVATSGEAEEDMVQDEADEAAEPADPRIPSPRRVLASTKPTPIGRPDILAHMSIGLHPTSFYNQTNTFLQPTSKASRLYETRRKGTLPSRSAVYPPRKVGPAPGAKKNGSTSTLRLPVYFPPPDCVFGLGVHGPRDTQARPHDSSFILGREEVFPNTLRLASGSKAPWMFGYSQDKR